MDSEKTNGTKAVRLSRAEKLLDAKADLQTEKLLKSLGDLPAEQKLLLLAKQLTEHEREAARQASNAKQNDKMLDIVKREKENMQKEYNKGILMRDKLEQVCREQQKLMKSVKSECSTRIRDEEEKRKEITAHFQKSINEIYATLNKNNEENTKLRDANVEMSKKFKFLAEQYEVREQQLGKINEQVQLESQLNDAKLAKSKMESTIDKEVLLKEKEGYMLELMAAKKIIIELKQNESVLKTELNMYTERYQEFQNAMQKSNSVFENFKVELDKMTKQTKKLEKETLDWRIKYEKCNKALLNMASDKQEQDAYVAKAARQLEQMQKLCRTLQAERTALIAVLTENNIERPVMPELPPAPVEIVQPPRQSDKLDIMSKNCLEMKQTIAALQQQMSSLSTKSTEAAKPAKSGKPKNKKPKNKLNDKTKDENAAEQNDAESNGQTNGEATKEGEATEVIAQTNGDTAEVVANPDNVETSNSNGETPETPVAEIAAPVAEIAAPVAEIAAPVAEIAAPVAEIAAPVAEIAAPVSEVAAVE